MAKKETKSKVLARVTFVADKMVQNLKRCLDKRDKRQFAQMPAIEVETGLLLATDGHILAAHKAKDYRCELGEGVFVMNGCYMLPVEVLKMKGQVTVEITSDDSDTVVSARDENGTCGEVKQEIRYPNWRAVMPWSSGRSIDVKAKDWDAVLKEMLTKMGKDNSTYPMRLYAEKKSQTIALNYYDDVTDETWKKDVEVGEMPYKVSVSFNCKRLRDVLAFGPTGMRFYDSSKAVMFHGDDTLVLLMPLWLSNNDAPACWIDKSDVDVFSFEKWLGAPKVASAQKETKPKAAKAAIISQQTEQATAEPTMADKLRAVLLARLAA